jgi:1,4-alpha-glucan branching enzyme
MAIYAFLRFQYGRVSVKACFFALEGGLMSKRKEKEKVKRRRVTLTLKAPKAKEVILMGDFNRWNAKTHPMKQMKAGVWEKIVMLPPGRYEYKFLVDGQWWTDPKNERTCYNCFGTQNSVMVID